MNETAYSAQRRKVRELKGKQDSRTPEEEAAVHHPAFKKKSKKKKAKKKASG
jgi:hypothetical protein